MDKKKKTMAYSEVVYRLRGKIFGLFAGQEISPPAGKNYIKVHNES